MDWQKAGPELDLEQAHYGISQGETIMRLTAKIRIAIAL